MGSCGAKPAPVADTPPAELSDEEKAKKAEEERRQKEKAKRAEALNRIEDTMKIEITFVKNEAGVTDEGAKICSDVAAILLEYPELMINIESHTSCSQTEKFNCNEKCRMLDLSQQRVESIKQKLIEAGCKNEFKTKGWGCKHETIGSVRKVKIFPEDLEWD